ncbi:hypothetical protein THARTR1_08158 [Trichoderma harzianum]|uniref:Heterokaryon incompatibility domain-containing protein n=1 Tax=Trichoderma harzianum TaxID=5544 RepID=A0A2K0U0D4_TRIHA|nr:hypothetical protein THARTR1_08158 [Trichoderma harzianum]
MIRLINIETLKLEAFTGKKIPKYAILSHTWGPDSEELTFDDFEKGITDKPGIGTIKLKGCCDQVKKDNIKEEKGEKENDEERQIKYVWIDTCCINKSSSSELQEAINAMFDWYTSAAVCYVYLSDVPEDDKPPSDSESKFFTSRWFSRGWTLQELLAPKEVRFYNAAWKPIGDKIEHSRTIEKITGISWLVLKGIDKIQNASVAQRMSWAARRETTRPEDLAYCLLGIFDIHMSMLYPEGGKDAFFRLQDLIMRKTGDDSILAWDHHESPNAQDPTTGGEIFAVSPAYFANSGKIVARKPERIFSEINVLGGRLGINLPLHRTESGELFGLLNCGPKSTKEGVQCVGIPLARATSGVPNEYIRPKEGSLRLCPAPASDSSAEWIQIKKDGQKVAPTDEQCWLYDDASFTRIHLELMEVQPSSWWDKKKGMISRLDSDDAAINRILMRCRYCNPESKTESPDFLFIIELNQPGSNAKHLFHTAICHRDISLLELAEHFRPELPNISGYASNGVFNLHITLDAEDGADRMSLTPGEAPESHDTINASSETEKIAAVSQFTKLLKSRKQEKAKEDRLRIDTDARARRLQFIKDQRQTVDDEIKKLEARRAMLIEEEQDKTREMNDLAKEQTQARKGQSDLFKELEVAHQRLRSVQPIEYSEVDLDDFDVDENDSEAQRKDDDVGRMLFREAIKSGDVEVMKILLAGSTNEDAVSNYGWLVLISAAFRGDADTVGGLLATNKVDPDSRDKRAGRTALSWAAENGHTDVVKLLLDTNKVNVNSMNSDRTTPLHYASLRQHEDIVNLLLDTRGIDVNLQDVYGYSPLHLSARRGYDAIVQLLLKKFEVDVNLRDSYKCTPLHYAASSGYEAVVQLLLERRDVDVNARDDHKNTPLHLAAVEGYEAVVQLLLQREEIDVNARNDYDNTPLHLAAFKGYKAVTQMILSEDDVGINAKNSDGKTPLHVATIKHHSAIVKLLIDAFPMDLNSQDREASTPLHYASAGGFVDVAKMLLNTNRVDVNARDVDAATPLHLAAERGHTSLVKLLVDRDDIDLNPRDVTGKTPLQCASDGDWGDARQLLLNRGAFNVYQRTVQGHEDSIEAVAFSHDSTLIASGSSDCTVKIWDRITGRCQKTLEGHNGPVNAVIFSHDSKLIASASNDSTIRIWNTTTGQCQRLLRGPRSDIRVEAVAFSHDSKLIISGSSDAIFKVWDAKTGKLLRSLTGHSTTIYAVAFSPNSNFMISASEDGVVILWNQVNQTHSLLETFTGGIFSVAFSEDSMYFYTASADGTVRSWSTTNGQCQQVLRGHGALVSSVAVSPTSPTSPIFIASGSFDETVKIWDADTGICRQTLGSKGAGVRALAFSHDANFVVSGLSDSTIKIWDMWLAFYASSMNPRRDEELSEERHLELRNQRVQDRMSMGVPMDGDSGLEGDEGPMAFGNNMSSSYPGLSRDDISSLYSRNLLPMNMSPNNDMAPRNMPQRIMSPINNNNNNMYSVNDMAPPMNGMSPGNGMLPDMYSVSDMPPMNLAYMSPRSMTPMDGVPLMNNMSPRDQMIQNNWMQSKMARRAQGGPGPGMQNWQS